MTTPKMISFDYGHTLLHEPESDFLRGEKEIYKHIINNPNQLSAEEISEFGLEIFHKLNTCRKQGFELHEWQILRLTYEYLGIELDISYAKAETILWHYVSCMPFVEEMLDFIKVEGIRSGVISNIAWSGNALKDRINRLLPRNQFEFIRACFMRLPGRDIFTLGNCVKKR